MNKLEDNLALPLRQWVGPLQLGLGAFVSCTGAALALGHLAAAL